MTDNVEFKKLKRKLEKTSSEAEKMKIIQELLELDPSFPGLSSQKKYYRQQLETLMRKRNSEKGRSAADMYQLPRFYLRNFIIGAPNSGKSTLLNRLTGTSAKVAEYPFTTFKPEIGMMRFKDINIQLVELPPIVRGDYEINRSKYELLRSGRGLAIVIASESDLEMTVDEISHARIEVYPPSELRGRERDEKPAFIVYRNMEPFDIGIPYLEIGQDSAIKELLYACLGIIRVYAFVRNKKVEEPFILDAFDASVESFARKIDKNFKDRFKSARIWGKSIEYGGQQVGLNHKLADEDMICLIEK
jgi:ribosome-interacting GTPase 1